MNDIRFAIRQLLKSPGFSFLAIATLAIGIGMNTAIFSVVHDLFLRGLSFKDPSRVIRIFATSKEANIEQAGLSVPKYWHYRDAQTVFTETAADTGTGFILTGMGDPVQINGDEMTANYLQLLGVQPITGRLFLPEEEMKADVAVVTERFWKNRLSGDPNVLGRNITLNGVATTIVGVIPTMPTVWFGPDTDVFCVKPFEFPGTPQDVIMRGFSFLRAIGRLKPAVTVEQARANLHAVHEGYRAQYASNADNGWQPALVTIDEDATGQLRPMFFTLLGAVAVVLLIACSNVANLLLVRFTGRRREISLRVALGASRSGIVRLFVVESTMLAIIAGVLGILMAIWVVPVIPKLAGQNFALGLSQVVSWQVLTFTFAVSLLTGVAMGAYPALQSSKSDLVEGLKEGGRGTSGSAGQQRFRRGLVAAQVCLSVVLLAGASLLIASFLQLTKERSGFRTDNLWVGGIGLPPARYPDKPAYARFAKQLEDELKNAPGMQAVALTDGVPLNGGFGQTPYARADKNPPPIRQRPLGLNHSISPGFLTTFGIPLIAGRNFTERDNLDAQPVVLISQSTAKKLFPGEDPVGKQMFFGVDNGTGLLTEIVGIVGDIRFRQLDKTDDIEFYRPIAQRIFPFMNVALRTPMRTDAAAATARAALKKIDPELPVIQPTTMEKLMSDSLGQQRLTTTLLGAFAGIALLLALIGIYGAVAYTVVQRTGEIGVRMALGAQAADVLRLIMRQGMMPVVIGLAAGIVIALSGGHFLATQLYQTSPHNPVLLALTAIALATVALLACLFPARRATLINPIQALRTE